MWWLKLCLLISSTSLCLAFPASPTSTACGSIVNNPNTTTFNASFVYECLTSVPFNPAVALGFLDYYNDTLQFQSTLTYLKNPPSSYQQPGVDLLGGLATLKNGVEEGIFPNQYEFEAALQTLLYAAHDGHVTLNAGILAAFSFSSPQDVVSLSLDGIQVPEVYLVKDLADSNFTKAYQPSPITSINGVDVVTYLTTFAGKNSIGMVEPHADWNQLMRSAAQDIQGYSNTFRLATFYPGDTITFTLGNGTNLTDNFQATYYDPGDTGPLETGGDFYNYFVLGLLPASYDPDLVDNNLVNITALELSNDDTTTTFLTSASAAATAAPTAAPTTVASSVPTCESWSNVAYPACANVSEEDLGTFGGGFVSGYFLSGTNIAVLSIPSFEGSDAESFDSAIMDFITKSQQANMEKVVIDVQSNLGGEALLATDAFKRFFPNINPFQGSRLRAHPAADVMGTAITEYFQLFNSTSSTYEDLITDEWVATTKINADTNQLFTSWSEEFGPHSFDGDNFTATQRYNLTNTLFDSVAVDDTNDNFTVFGYGSNSASANAVPAYAADDIIILTDAICDSSCTLFVEMMHHEAGVRVVVAGGRPVPGPMQGASGSRGARGYTTYELDTDIEYAQEILQYNGSANPFFLPNRTTELNVDVTYANINLRDQVRENETTPLQFAYEAADCRIFYTASTFYNYTALWQYAAEAIWTTPSLCVNGSTGFASSAGAKSNLTGPSPSSDAGTITANDILGHLNTSDTSQIPFLTHNDTSIEDTIPAKAVLPLKCESNSDCITLKKFNHVCAKVTLCDANGNPEGQSLRCLPACTPSPLINSGCKGNERCVLNVETCPTKGHCAQQNPNSNSPTFSSTNTPPQGVCDLVCVSGLITVKKSGVAPS
ncbi:hypothetical protein G7Y89_g2987 [Cudoniella acicularis]|uniref:Tail specific protease domain-containing protein n=1 Tax=Cudoniella acicularis TaxID=354080 RepID=A0A8H4RTI0_9HELO|nr:hypothetical protein G7Y89_g2987 [Cudoniella acicularis]